MSRFYDPNVILALAASYDTRGLQGFSESITNGRDQRKVNSMYEPVKNAFTGRTKLMLVNRPGLAVTGTYSALSSTDNPFLPVLAGGVTSVVFRTGSSTRVAGASTVTITTHAQIYPVYTDETNISGIRTGVIQLFNSNTEEYTTYYSSTGTVWTKIGHANYTSGVQWTGKMEHMDGFAFHMNSSSQVRNSSVNSLADWGANDYVTKSIEQDSARGLIRHGRTLLAFGIETVEGFYNAGRKSGSPLARMPQLAQRIGLSMNSSLGTPFAEPINGQRHYYASLGGRTYFVGGSGNEVGGGRSPSVYAFDGSRFEKVSSPFVDKMLVNNSLSTNDAFHVQAMTVYGKACIAISLVDNNTATQRALVFFPEWNDWFEWNSTGFQFVGSGGVFFGIGGTTNASTVAGFFEFSITGCQDAGTSYTMLHQFKLPKEDNGKARMDFAGLVGDTALDNPNANVSTSLSYDGYSTFTYVGNINMASQDKQLSRLGAFKECEVRLEYSGSTQIRLEKFIARVRK